MRTRTKGIQTTEDGERIVDRRYNGERIYARLGKVSQEDAEKWLRSEQNRIDVQLERRHQRLFCDAAKRYLIECHKKGVRTADLIGYHVKLILPYIGTLPLEAIHTGTLQKFCEDRLQTVSTITVNRTLEVVRSVLTKAARVWRDDSGKPWLASPPLIEMLEEFPKEPYPLTWEEQKKLFAELPPHLERMALFSVNTGLRDENICGLRWSWERRIPELGKSVFIIPAKEFKGKRPYVAVLNDVAMKIVESCRGEHSEYVFAYKNNKGDVDRIGTINNTAWQKARKRAQLEQVRVHDLRHTFGHRLRDAGVTNEDRAALLGHAIAGMAEHYAVPTIARLVELSNLVNETRESKTILRVVNG